MRSEREPFIPPWEKEPRPSPAEREFRAGRGAPTSGAHPGCKKCDGSGFMDAGDLKVYCDCRYV